jgi:hypothetical protein
MDMHRKSIETIKAGHGVVKRGAKKTQRLPDLQGGGNGTPPLRLQRFRLGGAVLSECIEARGLWTGHDKQTHITFKELKTVRCAIESFLPEL